MKNLIIVLSIIITFMFFTGCASYHKSNLDIGPDVSTLTADSKQWSIFGGSSGAVEKSKAAINMSLANLNNAKAELTREVSKNLDKVDNLDLINHLVVGKNVQTVKKGKISLEERKKRKQNRVKELREEKEKKK